MSLSSPSPARGSNPSELLMLLDVLPALVAYWDRDLRCRFASRTYEAWFGIPAERIIGMTMLELLGDALMALNLPYVEAALRGESQTFDRELPEALGRDVRFIQARYMPDVVDGEVRGFSVLVLDITARREAEQALQAREAALRAAQRIARMGTWTWEAATQELQWSREVRELLGLAPDFRPTREARAALYAPGTFERAEGAVQAALRDRLPIALDIEVTRRPNGVRFLRLCGEPLLDAAGAVTRYLGVVVDVTAQVEAGEALREREAQVLQLQKLDSLGRLAGGIAHDFNNMLMGIVGNIEFAREALGDASPAAAQALTEALECARRSAELTGQILAFARRQPIRPKLLDLGALVGEALPMLRRLIGESIELAWAPCDEPTTVRLDPTQVHQVLANLVLNSRDAIVGGGRIEVAAACARFDSTYCADHPDARVGPHVGLIVRDTGVGMAPDVAARAFEPFFTTKGGGAGLGLAIVHGVVAQNGGHVVLDSRPGAGTTLALWFPRAAQSRRADDGVARLEDAPRGTETVLVVEDEPAVRRLVVTSLKRLGYTVIAASAPDEALAVHAAHAEEIDVMVSDVLMPIMSGLDLARALRARSPGLPCLFVSGYAPHLKDGFGDLGDARLLHKPFRVHDLAVALREALTAAR